VSEPVLSLDDVAIWDRWQEVCSVHAQTRAFRRRVDSALRVVERAVREAPRTMVSWSGGKDSTVMTHLVCVRAGAKVAVVSEKDDLDFPGEEDYVRRLAEAWSLDLRIVRPPVSPWEWFVEHGRTLRVGEDVHGRSAGLSKACFYGVMESANREFDAVMMGLRSTESSARKRLRKSRGRDYELVSGRRHVLPIADWSGLDVLAYAHANGIELLPVYRCVALMHEHAPWNIRKSWWRPGASAWFGQIAWLRRYYPSLHARLQAVMPQVGTFASGG
jgi:3'-phosphoadenosine 5'-phosphosulfate sulfotransferase (PAPS reductase)/FAD synthetase